MLTLLCGQSAPTHLWARTVLDYTASRCCHQALWPDEVRLHSPQCIGLWLSFVHGCRQTRLEDWQNLFEDQSQGDVHPSGFPGQGGLSTLGDQSFRVVMSSICQDRGLVFGSPFPFLYHSQIQWCSMQSHKVPHSAGVVVWNPWDLFSHWRNKRLGGDLSAGCCADLRGGGAVTVWLFLSF